MDDMCCARDAEVRKIRLRSMIKQEATHTRRNNRTQRTSHMRIHSKILYGSTTMPTSTEEELTFSLPLFTS